MPLFRGLPRYASQVKSSKELPWASPCLSADTNDRHPECNEGSSLLIFPLSCILDCFVVIPTSRNDDAFLHFLLHFIEKVI